MTKTSLTPADMTCFALYSASHAMQRVYQPMLAPLGLTYPQFLVLKVLWSADGQTVGDLARAVMLESNTLTPLLKRMEAQGLVSRARVAEDERQVRVSLTDKARALEPEAARVSACFFEACGLELGALVALRDQIIGLRDRLTAAV